MPQFSPNYEAVATVKLTTKPEGLVCSGELYLVADSVVASTSGKKEFISTGSKQSIQFPIFMPLTPDTYKVFLDIFTQNILLGAYQAIEDVVIFSLEGVAILSLSADYDSQGGIVAQVQWVHNNILESLYPQYTTYDVAGLWATVEAQIGRLENGVWTTYRDRYPEPKESIPHPSDGVPLTIHASWDAESVGEIIAIPGLMDIRVKVLIMSGWNVYKDSGWIIYQDIISVESTPPEPEPPPPPPVIKPTVIITSAYPDRGSVRIGETFYLIVNFSVRNAPMASATIQGAVGERIPREIEVGRLGIGEYSRRLAITAPSILTPAPPQPCGVGMIVRYNGKDYFTGWVKAGSITITA